MKPLAVSMGEPAGVGPDIILMAHQRLKDDANTPALLVFGDPALLQSRASRLGLATDRLRVAVNAKEATRVADPSHLTIVETDAVIDQPGVLAPETGQATIVALERALDAVRVNDCAALVTAPIHKANLYATGFAFPGHTEYLEDYANRHWPSSDPHAVMMLAGPQLRTVPVTVHIPLAEVPTKLTTDQIITVAQRTARDLKVRWGCPQPRLAIAGLNPHAGEQGNLGLEDDKVISPAIAALKAEGYSVSGPWPADTLFHPEARATYDVALCMYHDQALIPVKTLDFHSTVNVTLGLPFVRTSPDHGTALDLAGTGKASPNSMIASIRLAAKLATSEAAQSLETV
ncbi:MAG: 4-hydroxythreonine-4-phosphate dehydrogenase PdxA [Pseudomonadota bacterium]